MRHQISDLGPEWYARFQAWLLACLKSSLGLPLRRGDMLGIVMQALTAEGLLTHPDTMQAIRGVIHAYLRKASSPRGVRPDENPVSPRCRAVQDFLYLIIDGWLPLMPPEVNLMEIVHQELEALLNTEVSVTMSSPWSVETDNSSCQVLGYYEAHREAFHGELLLRLVEWATKCQSVVRPYKDSGLVELFGKLEGRFLTVSRSPLVRVHRRY
jgi:hypothetical protein